MKFVRFPKLTNHYNKKNVYYLKKFENYIVTEKLDGANFSIWISKNEKKFATRNHFLAPDEKFYNWQSIFNNEVFVNWFNKYIKRVRTFLDNSTIDVVVLYGELFGLNVQGRINYGNEIQFRAYDMHLIGIEKRLAVDWDFLKDMVMDDNLIVPIIKENISFEEAMNIDINFNSKLTPEDYTEKNLCEGIVIKPSNNFDVYSPYPIVKKKNKKFMENIGKKKAPKKLSENVKYFVEFGLKFINENRVKSILSKLGEMQTVTDFGKYIKEFNYDWQKDFYNEIDKSKWDNLSKKDKKIVIKAISAESIKLLKTELMK